MLKVVLKVRALDFPLLASLLVALDRY